MRRACSVTSGCVVLELVYYYWYVIAYSSGVGLLRVAEYAVVVVFFVLCGLSSPKSVGTVCYTDVSS